ncbi:hypothetical protein ACFLU5_10185 [Bacteroidota bacterium]
MRKIKSILSSIIILLLLNSKLIGQDIYTTSAWEMIFSFADVTQNGYPADNIIRWAPVFNSQTMLNVDLSEYLGVFTGLGIRNVGLIYDDPEIKNVKYKYRNYTLGIPAGIKLGKLDGIFVYGGYEIEFPFHFKEKFFVNGKKEEKNRYWFSDRSERVFHTLLVGIQFPYGANLKFKYYLTNFFNQDFEATRLDDSGSPEIYRPYAEHEAYIFFFSLSFNLFKNTKLYYYQPE